MHMHGMKLLHHFILCTSRSEWSQESNACVLQAGIYKVSLMDQRPTSQRGTHLTTIASASFYYGMLNGQNCSQREYWYPFH